MIKSQEKLAQITHSKLKEDFQRGYFENDRKSSRRKNARREAAPNTRPTGNSKCFIKHKVNQ